MSFRRPDGEEARGAAGAKAPRLAAAGQIDLRRNGHGRSPAPGVLVDKAVLEFELDVADAHIRSDTADLRQTQRH